MLAGCGAKGVGGVDRSIDEQARRRAEHVGEDASAVELDHLAVPTADQLVGHRFVAVVDESLGAVVEIDEIDRAPLAPRDLRELRQDRVVGLRDPDVDLASARQADAQRQVVGDSIGQQPWLAAGEHLARRFDDLALDAAARNRACELTCLRDDQLGSDGTRRRAASGDDARHRDAVTIGTPAFELREDLPHRGIVAPGESGQD